MRRLKAERDQARAEARKWREFAKQYAADAARWRALAEEAHPGSTAPRRVALPTTPTEEGHVEKDVGPVSLDRGWSGSVAG